MGKMGFGSYQKHFVLLEVASNEFIFFLKFPSSYTEDFNGM